MDFQLFADSASDLPRDYFSEHDIVLLPLRVHIDKEEYEDLVTIESKDVFDAIRNGKQPKTSQASPQQMEEEFIKLADSGRKGLYIAFSSELSGTYQTAVMVRDQLKEEYPSLDLVIIDSKSASLGYGLSVKYAADLMKEGKDRDTVAEEAEFHCQHMEHLFTVEDLDYLAKGGRVTRASAFIGGLLNIKPLLHVEDGKLVPLEKLRGKKKLLKRIIEVMKERGDGLDQQVIGISHGDDEPLAEEIKTMIIDEFGTTEFFTGLIGSAVGAHAGPGTLAIFFLNKLPDSASK
ncbi:DegV family protein [Jeotgalibacillus proteolyticus]|uniref:Fatty acid-binding protein DegV n=1 Tax=Jeotgalibacillus proteolyticus TaxID=2082395 RepID=A0A2S5GH25_9BACL|nr:DegV family protein [Jeotgalibacillus proteolyticus]PPA72352.1 fatty acid-binding protein DegV [Jeotgalibacillus proteolyticus]